MMRHCNYFKYLVRHKWFVFVACRKIGASWWTGIVHDMSKFRPSEWLPYACTFYKKDGSKQYNETIDFACAWNDHQKRNKHHWQYYLITWDRGVTEPLPMPRRDAFEMVADWMGAGRAITGRWEVKEWYEKNKDKMILHPETKQIVDDILFKVEF